MSEGISARDLLIDYSGPIDFDKKKELITLLKEKINVYVSNLGLRKRCCYVFEELLTNAHEYYKAKQLPDEPVQVSLEIINKLRMEVFISNTVSKADTDELLHKIETLNQGDEAELRALFKESLGSENGAEGSAGLGLITVKLKNGLVYTFELAEKNKKQNHFCLTASVML
jgi:hypothetical protein